MSFNSLAFLIYLPVVLLIYWLLPFRFRVYFLLVASYFFYAFLNPWLIFLILATTLMTYGGSLGIEKTENPKKKKALDGPYRHGLSVVAFCLQVS
jgi:alginate O-acetyltransferase complex protein AlgI